MPESRPRVLLADDHLLFVKSLERLLEPSVKVVGTVGDGRALLEAVAAARPDVVVCDISMPGMDGLEATRRLVAGDSRVRVVMLSMHADPAHVRGAFHVGARGYVVKSAAPEELLVAIHEVLQDHYYLSPTVTGCLLRTLEELGTDQETDSRSQDGPLLTNREREVLALVALGLSNRRIAARLCVSQATVRSHLSHLYAKLDRSNRVELALYAVRGGAAHPGETSVSAGLPSS